MPNRVRRSWILLMLAGLLIAAAAPTAAQPTGRQETPVAWQPLGGPGGRITHLVAARATELYAVSVGGVNRRDDQTQWQTSGRIAHSAALYRSADGGATWRPLTNDLIPGAITALYADPVTGDLFVGVEGAGDYFTRRYGLWRSRDRGAHWEEARFGRNDLSIRRIVRSADGRRLYLGVTEAQKYPGSYIYRSADNGKSWTRFEALRFGQRPGNVLVDLVAHPTDVDRLFLTTYGGEVFVSQDAGETWSLAGETAEPPVALWAGSPRLAIVAEGTAGEAVWLVARTRSGAAAGDLVIERRTDNGAAWLPVAAEGLPAKGQPTALAALPGGVLLLGLEAGAYRSVDGGRTWQGLEGPLSAGEVAEFLVASGPYPAPAGASTAVFGASGYGLFVSRDGGALWQPAGAGLPFNSRVAALLTDARQPNRVIALTDSSVLGGYAKPPLVLRSSDGGRGWLPASQGLPNVAATAWALDPTDPDTLFVGSYEYIFRSTDGGLRWQGVRLPFDSRVAIAVAPSDRNVIYLGGQPMLRSTDRGATWQEAPIVVTNRPAGEQRSPQEVAGLVVDPTDARHVWAGLRDGVYETHDGGATWRLVGLEGQNVQWLADALADGGRMYAGVAEAGVLRWDGATWSAASAGLPPRSTIIAFLSDPRAPGTLWAARDGGGLYRSTDRGLAWSNAANGLGDNLVQALAVDYAAPGGILLGTATAGVWALRSNVQPAPTPKAADARIEIVWPHDGAAVGEAGLANIGLRLFASGSLAPSPCGWTPRVTAWQATDANPAEPLGDATQRTVDSQPFPFWDLNDMDVSRARQPERKLYFMVRVAGIETATNVWAHAADPRTYFPQQDIPSGVASGPLDAIDARIQIVWPHDERGEGRPVADAVLANVAVALFKRGTRLSVPIGWQPAGLTLYGAWNQEVGRSLATEAVVQTRQAGAITYPIWEFNNVPVARAADPDNKLYLWVMVGGVETYPTIWTHGADARTFFPVKDEPIQGCVP